MNLILENLVKHLLSPQDTKPEYSCSAYTYCDSFSGIISPFGIKLNYFVKTYFSDRDACTSKDEAYERIRIITDEQLGHMGTHYISLDKFKPDFQKQVLEEILKSPGFREFKDSLSKQQKLAELIESTANPQPGSS